MQLNDPKTIRAWTYYDWANSAYSLVITTAIFPLYYNSIVDNKIKLLGFEIVSESLASYSISLSFLIIAILSPILSSIADYRGNKRSFMQFFCYLGSAACCAMYFFKREGTQEANVLYGLTCSVLASIGYCGSIVFYNAYLPEIAGKEKQDTVSAKGFAMGYIGSVILMLVCFAFILLNDQLGWNLKDYPARISFVMVGIWWAGFAQITFRKLKPPKKQNLQSTAITGKVISNGYRELQKVWNELQHYPTLKKYLLSFFFYNMGVQTVMYMATYFASKELQMAATQLLSVVLIIQVVAIGGAWLFAKISERLGNKISLLSLVLIWIGICFAAYFVRSVNQFYLLAFAVGMVMGGIQSMSRSTYSKLLPATTDTASYFSFYDVCDKTGIVIGTLSFGLIAQLMGGMRNSTLALSCYFIIGLLLLLRIRKNEFEVKVTE
ncbi:MAG: MFS transporter [Chitinophagaceae bacterium]|nr:MFS transporter [Chitinophagaceae bacterium]